MIFVTNMAQYAVKGYEVAALDFIVKPVSYYDFALKMERVRKINESKNDVEILCSDRSRTSRITSKDICYIEVKGHYLEYHTAEEVLRSYGKISELEEKLKVCDFMRCNNCYLVNPRYIKEISGYKLIMKNGEELLVSHGRKKQFMTEFCEWAGEGKHL